MEPGIFARVLLAFASFFRVLFDTRFASQLLALREGRPIPGHPAAAPVERPLSMISVATPTPVPPTRTESLPEPVVAPPVEDPNASALTLLSLLQREGRFVDFLQERIEAFEDAEVGAAVRIVHAGCRRVLAEVVSLEPLRTEPEGAPVRVEAGFDASAIRLTGRVAGTAPFTGALRHHGWRAREVRLPKVTVGDGSVVAPAEVEL
ncbi:MAG: hypothetical protein RL199_2454 [Pseudomonadota bacterium]|jgi:hypothetical protein